jgi:small subunit ribosomal protein S21
MPGVSLKHERESFESLMRRFKRVCERDGTVQEFCRREYYEKPSIARKRQKTAAMKRNQRLVKLEKLKMSSKKKPYQHKKKDAKDRKRSSSWQT